MARWFRLRLRSVSGFPRVCLNIRWPYSVSTLPLIKPDMRISRIRLSDKNSRVRPRKAADTFAEQDETQLLIRGCEGESCRPLPRILCLRATTLEADRLRAFSEATLQPMWAIEAKLRRSLRFGAQRPPQRLNHILEFVGSSPISRLSPLRTLTLNQGPFPPSALPEIPGTTGLSATPTNPACPSRESG